MLSAAVRGVEVLEFLEEEVPLGEVVTLTLVAPVYAVPMVTSKVRPKLATGTSVAPGSAAATVFADWA